MWISTSEISVPSSEMLASECMHAGAAARVLYKSQRVFPVLTSYPPQSWGNCDGRSPHYTQLCTSYTTCIVRLLYKRTDTLVKHGYYLSLHRQHACHWQLAGR